MLMLSSVAAVRSVLRPTAPAPPIVARLLRRRSVKLLLLRLLLRRLLLLRLLLLRLLLLGLLLLLLLPTVALSVALGVGVEQARM